MSRRAWLAFAAMSFLWGVSYLLIKIGVDGGLPAPDVAWLRVMIAAVLLTVLAWRAGTLPALRGRWRWLVAYAVAEISIPFPLIAAGEVHVASSLAAIIIAAVPLIGAVLAMRFDHSERPTTEPGDRSGGGVHRGDRAGRHRRGRPRGRAAGGVRDPGGGGRVRDRPDAGQAPARRSRFPRLHGRQPRYRGVDPDSVRGRRHARAAADGGSVRGGGGARACSAPRPPS